MNLKTPLAQYIVKPTLLLSLVLFLNACSEEPEELDIGPISNESFEALVESTTSDISVALAANNNINQFQNISEENPIFLVEGENSTNDVVNLAPPDLDEELDTYIEDYPIDFDGNLIDEGVLIDEDDPLNESFEDQTIHYEEPESLIPGDL